jgi:DNA-binding winged helix-turn-helix (wHTH) protein/tetratricopeptide (TPR) repeat protein
MNSGSGRRRFGRFELDLQSASLLKDGRRIRLQPQPSRVLTILVEHAGHVVSREELRHAIWDTATFVEFDQGLNYCIRQIRQALGDNATEPVFVDTVKKIGYQFVAPVEIVEFVGSVAGHRDEGVEDSNPRRAFPQVVAVFLLAVLGIGASGYFYFRPRPMLTGTDTIVLADFVNTTGNALFDSTLRQGLAVQLEQTPFVRLLPPDQVTQTLRLMERPPDTGLTHEIAREVCVRASATVEVDGSIAPLGKQYVIGLSALNCRTGEVMAREQTTAKSEDDVLVALTAAVSGLRATLGESQASLRTYDVPLPRATTSSLEALQAFTRGAADMNAFNFPAAAANFERAGSLDPSFAAAHGVLGTLHAFLGWSSLAAEDARKAYALRDRVSEFERLFIIANYHLWATGDLERAVQADQIWTQTFPRESAAWDHLSYVYRLLGRNADSLAAALESLRLNPASGPTYTGPLFAHTREGRLDLALATLHEAEKRHLVVDFAEPYYLIAFLQHDDAGMAAQLEHLGPRRFGMEAGTAAYFGQVTRSRDLTARAVASAAQAHAGEWAAVLEARSALIDALLGNVGEARKAAARAMKAPAGWDAQANAALALALIGDAVDAQRIVADLNRRFPEGTFIQYYYGPAIRAALALREGKPDDAIANLHAVGSYEMAVNEVSSASPVLIPAYVRGEALLSARRGSQAAAEFQKVLEHPGYVLTFVTGALARLGLARAYVLSGESVKARAAYQDFLTLWKDADPDILVLKQAQAEYAALP